MSAQRKRTVPGVPTTWPQSTAEMALSLQALELACAKVTPILHPTRLSIDIARELDSMGWAIRKRPVS